LAKILRTHWIRIALINGHALIPLGDAIVLI